MMLDSLDGRQTVSVEEFAALIGISRGLAYRMVRDGSAPGVLHLGRRLISVPALMRWLDSAASSCEHVDCSCGGGAE